MKKTVLFVLAAGMAFSAASAKDKKKQEVAAPVAKVLTNDVDSMSYALGLNVGSDFARNLKQIPGGKSNIDLLVKGFATSMKGDSALIKKEDAVKYFRDYITKAQTAEADKKKKDAQVFLDQNKTKEGVKTTESGLQYLVLKAVDGPKPKETDSVTVHYTGTTVDGKVFDSSVERGEPITFPLNQVIKGWTEGVQLMSVGSKYKFFIPYELAYGEQGAGQAIPPFSTLIFDVELLAIKPVKEAAPEVSPAASKATAPAKSAPAKKTAPAVKKK